MVRYAKRITLRVTLDNSRSIGKEETIYAPLLEIHYRERNFNYIKENPLTKVSFTAEYSMDTSKFWRTENVMFVFICILAAVVLLIKMAAFMMQGNLGNDDFSAKCKYFFVRLIIDSLDVYSNILFWYLFSVTVYWFTFFKWQENVYILLPPLATHTENYYPFDCLFAVVASFKLVSIAYKIIFEQSSFDVFMIDWERPKCKYYDS